MNQFGPSCDVGGILKLVVQKGREDRVGMVK